jgi:hypothetical protein
MGLRLTALPARLGLGLLLFYMTLATTLRSRFRGRWRISADTSPAQFLPDRNGF